MDDEDRTGMLEFDLLSYAVSIPKQTCFQPPQS